MALFKCPDCSNDVSDNASFCPKCGCKFETKKEKEEKAKKLLKENDDKTSRNATTNGLFLILFLILYYLATGEMFFKQISDFFRSF